MLNKAKPSRDPFTFSLGGMATIASFVAAPAVASDRLNQVRDNQPDQVHDDRNHQPQLWLRCDRQAA